ncbi:MAG TPA: DUF3105 domain-containing protein [Polyangiaceae bacterium]
MLGCSASTEQQALPGSDGGVVSTCVPADCSAEVTSVSATDMALSGGACNVEAKTVTGLSALHVDLCAELDYPDNPPAGGNHYPIWAAFQSYSFPVPRGFWVHDLEHGAIVFSYNCADGCPDEVAQVQALIDALPADPLCGGDPPRRVVMTPDPLLDVRWGASAWGHTLRADCIDADRFTQFYSDYFGQGREQLCVQGSDFDGMPPCQSN